ncbi:MAG: formimidoylglutamase [Flavobacteriaceae bacterium]|nr:formimidoylglutamase [Bacteroidia bacterium]MBT8287532.1 formimidoylglutamase [Bacteroidia bacterium]NNF75615.1 formimidoylglutamase [Flavobacteriaceae bacterium]NNK74219.1 formimidoylglutamase [Flavobacteriaceae bacterium]
MNFSFLSAVEDRVVAHNELLSAQALGRQIKVHSSQFGVPDLDEVKIALIGVPENRNDVDYIGEDLSFEGIRTALYGLFPGNWASLIADLGNIQAGETVEDTYFALRSVIHDLLKRNIIPIVLGGSQDLTYPVYRAYDDLIPMINIVNVDSNFDLGDSSKPITNKSFLGKIIMEKPYNLFNYATLGYQTYFNAQDEIDLMEKLYFEAYRLGDVSGNIKHVEPVLRDANIMSLDLRSVRSAELSLRQRFSPNGFDGKEICAISRYAGISNKVSSFGIFEYKPSKDDDMTAILIAQIIWYFIEGVNCRIMDEDFDDDRHYQKFTVLADESELKFLKSNKTGRWWIEIPFLPNVNNKLKRHTLLPCMHEDYVDATNGIIPERWYKAFKKNSL